MSLECGWWIVRLSGWRVDGEGSKLEVCEVVDSETLEARVAYLSGNDVDASLDEPAIEFLRKIDLEKEINKPAEPEG